MNTIRPRRLEYNTVLRDRQTGTVYPAMDGWERATNTFSVKFVIATLA
jgi:hypothetical protein